MATSSISSAVTSVGTISSPGLGSGLDVDGIVSQLVAIEKQPITQLQTDASKMQSQLSAWGKIKSALSSLRDAASTLNLPGTWATNKASSADSSAVSVSADSTAAAGTYNVRVVGLASSQSVASSHYAATTSTVGQGTLSIQLGSWNADHTAFTPGSAAAVDIAIGAGEDTLEGIRDKINAAGAGVTASIVTDTQGSRLVINGETGAANGFRISVTDNDGDGTDTNGLSALAYDPSGTIESMTRTQSAADAEAEINGLSVRSATNEIRSVGGLVFTVGKPTSLSIAVSVSRDTEAIAKSISNFASSYSSLVSLIKEQTKYDDATKTAATLQGDGSAVSLESQFRSLVGGSSGASSIYQTLSQVGLSVQSDGTLAVNATKLQSALTGNLADVKKLFSNSDSTNSSNDGIAQRFRALGDQVLGVDGLVSTRTGGIQARLDRNSDRQEDLTERAARFEARLRAQYTSLDTQLSKLNSLSSYVSQQLTMLNNFYNKS